MFSSLLLIPDVVDCDAVNDPAIGLLTISVEDVFSVDVGRMPDSFGMYSGRAARLAVESLINSVD